MSKVVLNLTYVESDIKHLLHTLVVPSEFSKKGSLIITDGHGVKVRDNQGREYIDASSNSVNVNIGWGNKELVEAAREQMSRLPVVCAYFGRVAAAAVSYAAKLAEVVPGGLNRFYFACSGSEANETAFKIVWFYWRQKGQQNKYKIISLDRGYHGQTIGALAATGMAIFKKGFEQVLPPGFIHIPSPYCYRCPFDKEYPKCNIECADALKKAIEKEGEDTVAEFIGEPVIGSGGMIPPPPEYWPKIREICTRHNVLLHLDEVMTGFGRTGKLWASEHWGVKPDIMTMAKGITSSYMPLSGVAITEEIYEGMCQSDAQFPHILTASDHPVSCAVAEKHLEILLRDKLVDRAAEIGVYTKDRLISSLGDLPCVGEVRGLGLMIAVELVADKQRKARFDPMHKVGVQVLSNAQQKGVLLRCVEDSVLLAPPLIITKDEVNYVVDVLKWVLEHIKLG